MELNSELDRLQKYAEIDSELKRAEKKHPIFPNDMFRQLAIMQEEAGEVTKAVLHYHYENGALDHVREELIQTAAMCMRMLQDIDRKQESNKDSCRWAIGMKIISAFPGTGKSYYCNNPSWEQYVPDGFCCDSDSSKFDKTNFPQNYIDHIKQRILDGYARIFISSHKDVRDALVANGLEFTLVYPDKSLKEEYMKRYKDRGNSDQFLVLLEKNWENWIDECMNQSGCTHIVLKSGQFITDVI